jgi:4,5-DOPA dioxygenase extradiol
MANTVRSMPAIFVGHGNPMNVVRRNRWTEGWAALGDGLPRPKAILMVSAHWYIPATRVTAMPHPRTIHDFAGFPQELYDVTYPAPGDPVLPGRVRDLCTPMRIDLDERWGLDHGGWSVLHHMFLKADIPVVQVSIDRRQPPSFHYEVGRLLTPLRDEGILLMGSGNLVHNLQAYQWDQPDVRPFDWALRFEENIRGLLLAGKDSQVVDYPVIGPDADLSIPTPDHYLPLLAGQEPQKEQAA